MKTLLCWALAASLVACAATVQAGDGLSKWSPFTKKTTTSRPMLNGKPLYVTTSNEPTTFSQRFGVASKSAAKGVGDAVTLKALRQKMGSQGLPKYSNSYKAPQPTTVARSGGLKSWFKKPEERQPQTMGEWMLQGRPK